MKELTRCDLIARYHRLQECITIGLSEESDRISVSLRRICAGHNTVKRALQHDRFSRAHK